MTSKDRTPQPPGRGPTGSRQAPPEVPPFVSPYLRRPLRRPDEVEGNHHVPQLTSPECHTHLAYVHPKGGTTQLICCSATLEFYDVLHSVEPRHVWDGRSTFFSTIVAIRRAIASHYQGRFQNG